MAELALCLMPELGEKAGSTGPLIASIGDLPLGDPSRVSDAEEPGPDFQPGCTFPHELRTDPFTGQQSDAVIFPGSPLFAGTSLAGPQIRGVAALQIDASKQELNRILKRREVAAVGKPKDFKSGGYVVVIVDHDELSADVGLNLFSNLDGKPYNDVPVSMDNPTSPIAGNDGGWTVFGTGASAPRILSTDFRDGRNTWYAANHAAAAVMTSEQTAFLIPDRNHGDTVTPFFFDGAAYQVAGPLPHGVLPVSGHVPLLPGCGPSQEIIHEPLTLDGVQVSASTDSIAICFRLDPAESAFAQEAFLSDIAGNAMDQLIEVAFDSFDGQTRIARKQNALAYVRLEDDRLYVTFPSGLLRYGYHVVTNVSLASMLNPALDPLLAAAANALTEWLVPVVVSELEGIIDGGEACQPPWTPPPPTGG